MIAPTPRQTWEQWQREGRPTLGSRKTLPEYLVSHAQWHVSAVLVDDVRGRPVDPRDVAEVWAAFDDLRAVVRLAEAF